MSFSFKYLTSVFLISGKINLEGFYVASLVLGYYLVGYFVVGGGVGYAGGVYYYICGYIY